MYSGSSSMNPNFGGNKMAVRGRRKKEKEYELDPHRLAQRQKQIMYGENTKGFSNFLKAIARDPSILKGCVPIKPSIVQKCSKRSWDGQVRKWRRALHMYDYVDFGESEEQTREVRDALIEQNVNPIFSPQPKPTARFTLREVTYSLDDLLYLAESPLVQDSVQLPEALAWLDKRVDLEDDVDDDSATLSSYSPHTPHHMRSPMRSPSKTPLRAIVTERKARIDRTPLVPRFRSVSSEPKIWLHNQAQTTPQRCSPKAETPKSAKACEGNKENNPYFLNMTVLQTPPHRHHPYMYPPLMFASPYQQPYKYNVY